MKELLREKFPPLFKLLKGVNMIRLQREQEIDRKRLAERNAKLRSLSNRIRGEGDAVVLAGPFKGLVLADVDAHYWHPNKLLGQYESELHSVIESLKGKSYQKVINIGCADGYYSSGLAMLMPDVTVEAYDIDLEIRKVAEACADRNKLENISFYKECTHESLEESAGSKTLVVIDCEGFEDIMLDPSKAPSLLAYDILVETHDHLIPEITNRLKSRFSNSHSILEIVAEPRSTSEVKNTFGFSVEELGFALNEFRKAPGHWFWMESK